uniref:Ranatuerin-2CSa n=1 Tax=Rana cascadae TaxID=160497 RepID=RN2A_RANCS|nr:RecName: Full=Ranatuerin-2CSa [Rana cascadae]2K10_A Chain A, ranatuerin-2csa [Rana cascadae]
GILSSFKGVAKGVAKDLAGKLLETLKCKITGC